MPVHIRFDWSDVRQMLQRGNTALRDTRAAWLAAAVIYYKHVAASFRAEGLPDKWLPLAESTLRRRRQGKTTRSRGGSESPPLRSRGGRGGSAKILQDTGILRKAATSANSPGGFLTIEPRQLTVGVTLKYGGVHQYGHRHVPARPYLTTTAQVTNDMAAAWMAVFARRLHKK